MLVAAQDLGHLAGVPTDRRPATLLIARGLMLLNPALTDKSDEARRAREVCGVPDEESALGGTITTLNDKTGQRGRGGKPAGDTRGAWSRAKKALFFSVDNPNGGVKTLKRRRRRRERAASTCGATPQVVRANASN